MKKMYSTWSKQSLLGGTMRLMFVVVLLFNATAALGSDYYAKFSAQVASGSSGKGKVYVSETTVAPAEGDWAEVSTRNTTTTSSTQQAYLYAKANDGYYLSKWAKTDGGTSIGNNANGQYVSVDAKASKNNENKRVDGGTYYAHFEPVSVLGAEAVGGNIQTKGLHGTATKDVVFNVSNADDVADFTYSVSGVGFEIVNAAYANNKVTLTVQYTDQNIHGSKVGTATVRLRSKGAAANIPPATATIYADSDLQPTFTPPADYNYGDIYKGDAKTSGEALFALNMNNTASHPDAEWYVTWQGQGDDADAFTCAPFEQGKCVVTFTPKDRLGEYSVALILNVSYTDSKGTTVTSSNSTVTVLKVNVIAPTESKIVFDPDSYDFGSIQTMEVKSQLIARSLQNVENVTYSFGTDLPANFPFSYELLAGYLRITAAPKAPGSYSATLTATGDDTRDGHSGEKVSAQLTLRMEAGLKGAELTGFSNVVGKHYLTWTKVPGATSYEIYEVNGGVQTIVSTGIEEIENTETHITKTVSATTNKTYVVKALSDGTPQYTSLSNELQITSNILTTNILPYVDLWTGTEGGSDVYPHKIKRQVDLKEIFNDQNKPLYDKAYVFGLTTTSNGGALGLTNAVTPCYVFTKSGDAYTMEKIDNVNVATKPAQFIINTSGQKIYMTGYAPYASCGSTWWENGVFFFGAETGDVDLYLDNFQVYARPKAVTGTTPITKTYKIAGSGDLGVLNEPDAEFNLWELLGGTGGINFFVQGSGAVLCFQPTNLNGFKPTIHLRGNNMLESALGAYIHVDVTWPTTLNKIADQHSSPIQIIHTKDTRSKTTTLSIDDIWISGERTNGILNLANKSQRAAPTIDLGNDKTTLNINGGQLFLSNAFNTSDQYTVSYAISYRNKAYAWDGRTIAAMFGIGDDQPGGVVNFNDGSINCAPLVINMNNTKQKEVFERLYHNATSMKCPQKTYVNGGTFSCDVLSCAATESKGSSPKNSAGKALCSVTIPVASTTPIGTAVLANDWMTYASQNGANTTDLAYYGIQSMQPKDGEVHLLLPSDLVCFKDEISIPWVMCIPEINAKISGVDASIGGNKTIEFSAVQGELNTTVTKTSRLLYGQLGEIIQASIATYEPAGDFTFSLSNNLFQAITNPERYAVYEKIYMMVPVVANEWKMFTPPFDVSNVYVIDAYPEDKLKEEFGTTINGKKVIESANVMTARYAQSHRTLDMIYNWLVNTELFGANADIWSNDTRYPAVGNKNSMALYLVEWMNMYPASETPKIEQLYHYAFEGSYPTGKTCWDANFYLYKAGDTWTFDAAGNLQPEWNEVNTISLPRNFKGDHNVIMKKGEVYVYSFPHTVYNDGRHNPETMWDYWTGKYILLEGYPTEDIDSDGNGIADCKGQMLSGSEKDWNNNTLASTMLANYTTANSATLRGNYTFSVIEVMKDNAFFLNRTLNMDGQAENVYIKSTGQETLYPTDGFMLANVPALAAAPQRRAVGINFMTGAVTYEDDQTATSTPTIVGDHKMLVYTMDGGLGIIPVAPQQVTVYNAAGQLVTSQYVADEVQVNLPSGIYFVCGENDRVKAMVK